MTAKPRPTAWAKRGGAGSSRCSGAASRGRTTFLNRYAVGVCCTPEPAPTAKNTVWRASNAIPTGAGAISRTAANNTSVTPAENRGPRGSIPGPVLVGAEPVTWLGDVLIEELPDVWAQQGGGSDVSARTAVQGGQRGAEEAPTDVRSGHSTQRRVHA